MLKHMTLGRLYTPCTKFFKLAFFNFNSKTALLESQFHKNGYKHFKKGKMSETYSAKVKEIEKIEQKIEQIRNNLVGISKRQLIDWSSPKVAALKESEEYFHHYSKLVKEIDTIEHTHQWIWHVIGWYNITPQYLTLLRKLLKIKQDKKEQELCIQILSWMKYTWPNEKVDRQFLDDISQFYKNMSNISAVLLLKLDKILVNHLTFSKRKCYELYFANNIANILKYLNSENAGDVSMLIELFQLYVNAMNDHEVIIGKIEKYIITYEPVLSKEDIERLIQIYEKKGAINPQIYQHYILKYLKENKFKNINDLTYCLKFIIYSECKDQSLLKLVVDAMTVYHSIKSNPNAFDKTTLHKCIHYLKITKSKVKFPPDFTQIYDSHCKKKSEGRAIVTERAITFLQEKFSKRKNIFISDCLKANNNDKMFLKETEPTEKSKYENEVLKRLNKLNLQNYRFVEKPVFCSYELDIVFINNDEKILIDVEVEGIQYVFISGRLTREKQIRDQILKHYGFKINHLDYYSLVNRKILTQKGYEIPNNHHN